jgi:hypothetical protein
MKQEIAFELGIYCVSVILAGLLWHKPLLLTSIYLMISFIMLYKWHTKSDFIFYAAGLVLGPAGEIFAVYLGAWQYAKPFFLIPLWLPFLWGIAVLFFKKLSESLLSI